MRRLVAVCSTLAAALLFCWLCVGSRSPNAPDQWHRRTMGFEIDDMIDWLLQILGIDDDDDDEPSLCTCKSCTQDVWNRMAGDSSCGDRIEYLKTKKAAYFPTEKDACARIADLEFPEECGPCNPMSCDGRTRDSYCGLDTCDVTTWKSEAEGSPCKDRIRWVQTNVDPSESAACRQVASEFPTTECGLACNPATTQPDLYCFPDSAIRTSYQNAWGKHLVEVKDSSFLSVCGPENNKFTGKTVSMFNDELTSQFKCVNGGWEGSEVRVVPMDGSVYDYGTYEFSVKSVKVKKNGMLIANELPISLVLGLFAWDPTDDFAIRENCNHEVDIEISQWDSAMNQDAQFLMQPPGSPQMHRFWSGGSNGKDQGGHRWQFTWNPGVVSWSADAGGNQAHSFSTEQAINAGLDDYVQCLPASVEVRMNLWNMHGANTPTGMLTDEIVEVVIDDFVHTPSELTGVTNGGVCSKDCQCQGSSSCVNGSCTLP